MNWASRQLWLIATISLSSCVWVSPDVLGCRVAGAWFNLPGSPPAFSVGWECKGEKSGERVVLGGCVATVSAEPGAYCY